MKITLIAAAAIALTAGQAEAQGYMARKPVVCGPHKAFVETLRKKHSEVLHERGIGPNELSAIAIYRSAKGSFTIMEVFPDGKACMIASGEDLEMIEAEPLPTGEPA